MDAVACTRIEEENKKTALSAASATQVVPHKESHKTTNVKDNEAELIGLKNEVRGCSASSSMFNGQTDSWTDAKDSEEVRSASASSSFSRNMVVQKEQLGVCLSSDESTQKEGEAILGQLQNWFGATENHHLLNSDILMTLNSSFPAPPVDSVGSDLTRTSSSTRALQFWDRSVPETEKPPFTSSLSSSALNTTTPETLTVSQPAVQGSGPSTNTSAVIAKTLSLQFHKTRMCPFFERGHCRKGVECTYAHDRGELRSAPNLYKTKLCEEWQRGTCRMEANCRFAHGRQELRFTDQVYKTRICHFWSTGDCSKGRLCRHAHGYHELRLEPNLTITGRAFQAQDDDQRYSKIMSGRSGLLPITASRTCPTGSSKRRDTSPMAPGQWRGAIRRENEDEYKDVKPGEERKIRRCFTSVGFQQLADSVNNHLHAIDAQHNDARKLTDSRWSLRRSSSLHHRSSFLDVQLQTLVSDQKRVDSQGLFQTQNNTYVSGANDLCMRKAEAYNALNSCASNKNRALMLMNSASSPALQTLCQSPPSPPSRSPPLVSISKTESIEQITATDKGCTNGIGLAEQFQRVAQHAIQLSVCQLEKRAVFTKEASGSRQNNLTGVPTARCSSRARTSPIFTSPFLGSIVTDAKNSVSAASPLRASPHDRKSASNQSTGCVHMKDAGWEDDAVKEVERVQNASQLNMNINSFKQHFSDFCNNEENVSPLLRFSSSGPHADASVTLVAGDNEDTGVGSGCNSGPPHSPGSEMSLCQSSTSLSSSLSTLPQAQDGGSSMEPIAHIYDASGVSPTMTTVHNPQDSSPSRTLSSDPFERQSSGELLKTIQHKDQQHGLDSDGSQSRRDAFFTLNGSKSILDIFRQEVCDDNVSEASCWNFAGQSTMAASVTGFSPRQLGLNAHHRQQQCEGNTCREPVPNGDGHGLNSTSRLLNAPNIPHPTSRDCSLNRIGMAWNIGVDTINALPHTVVQAPGGTSDPDQLRDSEQPKPRRESRSQAPHAERFPQQQMSSPLLPFLHLGESQSAGLHSSSQASVESSSNTGCCQIDPLVTSLHTSSRSEIMSPPPGLAPQRKNVGPSPLNTSTVSQQPPDTSWGGFLGRLSSETRSHLVHDSESVEKGLPRYRSFRYSDAQYSLTKNKPTKRLSSRLIHNLWQSQLSTLDTGDRACHVSSSVNTFYNAPLTLPRTSTAMSAAQDAASLWEERGNCLSPTPLRLRRPRRSVSAFFLPRWLSTRHEESAPLSSDSSNSISRVPLTLNSTAVHGGVEDPRSDGKASRLQPPACLGRSRTPTWEEDLDLEYPQYAAASGNLSDVLLTSSPTAKNNNSVSQEAVGFQNHFSSTFNNSYRFPSNIDSGRANRIMSGTAGTGPFFARGSSMPCPGFTPSSLLPDLLQQGTSGLEWAPTNGPLLNSFSGADLLPSFHGYSADTQRDTEKCGMWQTQEQPYGIEEPHRFRKTPRSSTLFASPIRGIPRADRADDHHQYGRKDVVFAQFRPVLNGSTSMELDRLRAGRMPSDFSEGPSRSGCYMPERPNANSTTNKETFKQPTSLLSFLSRAPHKKDDTRDNGSVNIQDTQDDWCSRMAAEFLSDGSENSKRHHEGHSREVQGAQEPSSFTCDTTPLPWLLRLKHEGIMPSPFLLHAKIVSSDECVQQVSNGDGGVVVPHTPSSKENTEWDEQPVLTGTPSAEFRTPQSTSVDHNNTIDVKLVNGTGDIQQTTSSEEGEEDDNEKKGRVRNISIQDRVEEELPECPSEPVASSLGVSSFPKTGNIVGLVHNTSLCEIFKNYLEREESQKQKSLGSVERLKKVVFQSAATLSTPTTVPQELHQALSGDGRNATRLKYYASEASATLQTLCGPLPTDNSGLQNHFQMADLSPRTPESPLAVSYIDSMLPR